MAPRKVDKEAKRKEIALACYDMISQVGIRNITVAQVAKTAGIGKGTVYEYFDNKYDIVFEIINHHVNDHLKVFDEKVANAKTVKEKIFFYYEFAMSNANEDICDMEGYKDYISVCLSENSEEMINFNQTITNRFKQRVTTIIEEAIVNNELKAEARNFVDALISYEKGLIIRRMMNGNINVKDECEEFIDSLLHLLKV